MGQTVQTEFIHAVPWKLENSVAYWKMAIQALTTIGRAQRTEERFLGDSALRQRTLFFVIFFLERIVSYLSVNLAMYFSGFGMVGGLVEVMLGVGFDDRATFTYLIPCTNI